MRRIPGDCGCAAAPSGPVGPRCSLSSGCSAAHAAEVHLAVWNGHRNDRGGGGQHRDLKEDGAGGEQPGDEAGQDSGSTGGRQRRLRVGHRAADRRPLHPRRPDRPHGPQRRLVAGRQQPKHRCPPGRIGPSPSRCQSGARLSPFREWPHVQYQPALRGFSASDADDAIPFRACRNQFLITPAPSVCTGANRVDRCDAAAHFCRRDLPQHGLIAPAVPSAA